MDGYIIITYDVLDCIENLVGPFATYQAAQDYIENHPDLDEEEAQIEPLTNPTE